jgi:hypothetical protein
MDNGFYIYNYLNKRIGIYSNTNNKINNGNSENITIVNPNSKKKLSILKMERYFSGGSSFSIYILDSKNKILRFLSEHKLDFSKNNTIKKLHVGMVTSKWMGSDGNSHISPGDNAVQGLPWIKIHNKTNYPLYINNNIIISPGGTEKYKGRDHFGVRLGTIFKDQDGIFPDFIFSTPATELYYGITSDIQQSLFGGFQLTPDFIESDYEPHFLLEKGWMGGGANSQLKNGFIPLEGEPMPTMDRWGNFI